MKPSIEQVLQKLIELSLLSNAPKNWIPASLIAEELNEHQDNVAPILIQLAREECIKFSRQNNGMVLLLKNEMSY